MLAVVLIAVGMPAAGVCWKLAQTAGALDWSRAVPSGGLLLSSLAWAAGIGVLATAVAWPVAWVFRGRGWWAAPAAMTPMLLPGYLCYAAYGLARAPQTWLGDWIERAAQGGVPWLPVAVGRALAVCGLSLWAWPLAAVALWLGLRRVDQAALDALALEPMGRARRWWQVLRMSRGAVGWAVLAVTLLMLGSAVPLHLANVPTYSVRVWFDLTMTPGGTGVWLTAWPLVAVAAGAGALVRPPAGEWRSGASGSRGASRGTRAWVWVVVLASTVVPWALLAGSLKKFSSLETFWRVNQESALQSVGVAALSGLGVAAVCVLAWAGLSASGEGAGRRVVVWSVRVLLAAGLMPGILVGRAIVEMSGSLGSPAWLSDGPAVLIWANLARFGFVGALAGCWLAWSEDPGRRELRRLDRAGGLLGWWAACVPGRWPAVVGVGLAGCALSLHEIEAAIIVQPPGTPNLAQVLLGDLHFARSEDFAAASVQIVGLGLVVAGLSAVALRRAARAGESG